MPDRKLTFEDIATLKLEVKAKIDIMAQYPDFDAYVGLHPVVLGKLINLAEKQLAREAEECQSKS